MPKVIVVQQVYKSRRYVKAVYDAIFAQTFKDFKVVAQIVVDDGGSKEYLQTHYPNLEILDPGYNIGFSRGHNEIFAKFDAELFQLVNPDLILDSKFLENMVKTFDTNLQLGSASGKIFQYDFGRNKPLSTLDTTGVTMSKSGAGRDRGQNQVDRGQYDNSLNILGPSGAAAAYRKSALETVKYLRSDGHYEYFDEDFHSYWEDVDLAWRLINAGFQSQYVPGAVAFHGRTAASSPGGYKKVFAFVAHHKKIPPAVRKLNYKNHIFMFIKNSPKWYWQFFVREFFYQLYVLFVEPGTLGVVPQFFKQYPLMLAKRKYISNSRKVNVEEMERYFT